MPPDHLAACGAGIQVHVEDLAVHLARRERCDAEARFDELLPRLSGSNGQHPAFARPVDRPVKGLGLH